MRTAEKRRIKKIKQKDDEGGHRKAVLRVSERIK